MRPLRYSLYFPVQCVIACDPRIGADSLDPSAPKVPSSQIPQGSSPPRGRPAALAGRSAPNDTGPPVGRITHPSGVRPDRTGIRQGGESTLALDIRSRKVQAIVYL